MKEIKITFAPAALAAAKTAFALSRKTSAREKVLTKKAGKNTIFRNYENP